MSNNIKKELLGLMQKAVKLEVEKNGNEASRYCPVILHQPKRPKKLKQVLMTKIIDTTGVDDD